MVRARERLELEQAEMRETVVGVGEKLGVEQILRVEEQDFMICSEDMYS